MAPSFLLANFTRSWKYFSQSLRVATDSPLRSPSIQCDTESDVDMGGSHDGKVLELNTAIVADEATVDTRKSALSMKGLAARRGVVWWGNLRSILHPRPS